MIVFYTGTGNSRYCAQALAAGLGDGITDAFPYIRSGAAAELASERPWVFVSPTYAWRLPRIFTEFLRRASLRGSRDAYFLMTCGDEIGDAGRLIGELCREKGLRFRGVCPIVMPENYIALFTAPDTAEAARITAAARPALDRAAETIRRGGDFPASRPGVLDRIKTGPVNRVFYRFVIKAGPFRATDACVGCGRCAETCVLGNIALREGKPVWGNVCTHCMACICGCPKQAVEYGGHTRGKTRYRCADFPG